MRACVVLWHSNMVEPLSAIFPALAKHRFFHVHCTQNMWAHFITDSLSYGRDQLCRCARCKQQFFAINWHSLTWNFSFHLNLQLHTFTIALHSLKWHASSSSTWETKCSCLPNCNIEETNKKLNIVEQFYVLCHKLIVHDTDWCWDRCWGKQTDCITVRHTKLVLIATIHAGCQNEIIERKIDDCLIYWTTVNTERHRSFKILKTQTVTPKNVAETVLISIKKLICFWHFLVCRCWPFMKRFNNILYMR